MLSLSITTLNWVTQMLAENHEDTTVTTRSISYGQYELPDWKDVLWHPNISYEESVLRPSAGNWRLITEQSGWPYEKQPGMVSY